MDRSSNKDGNNPKHVDGSTIPVADENIGRKRKRNDASASTSFPQHHGSHPTDSPVEESNKEHHVTLLQRALEENRELRIKLAERDRALEERDREIEVLRSELEKQRGNVGMVASQVSGNRVQNGGNTTNTSDQSTDYEESHLSSKSSDDDVAEEDDGEKKEGVSSETSTETITRSPESNLSSRPLTHNDSAQAVDEELDDTAAALTSNGITEIRAGVGAGAEVVDDSTKSLVAKKVDLKAGVRLAIYWPNDDKYYKGIITTYDAVSKKHFVKYDDGETAWETLDKETYYFLDNGVPFGDLASVADAQQDEESDGEIIHGRGRLAFCCQNCTCDNSKTNTKDLYSCVNSTSPDSMFGNVNLFHKGCCHNETGDVNTFKSPMQVCRENGFSSLQQDKGQECSLDMIKQKYANASKEYTKFANAEDLEAADSKIFACQAYVDLCKQFHERKGKQKNPLRVLELFSGIGSGTLALKRLRIPVHTVVHCDHDPIANEVCKFNHQGDGIKHVYIDTFEEIYGESSEPDEEKIAKLVADCGPIDLVLAGAPCSQYSGLNARRDLSCANAQYLPNVGKLIAKLNDIQKKRGAEHDALFLSENVVFKNYDCINKYYGQLEPIRLDAEHFSPCKRSRLYWCNIPLGNVAKYTDVASQVSVDYDGILDPGSGIVERLNDDSAHLPVKANTFLASLTKIDDGRMLKYSTEDSGIKLGHYSVREREKMMGLPPGYVSKPVKTLFNEIATCAILHPETSADGKTYRDFMDPRFWYLRKKVKFQHYPKKGEDPYFEIGIATPRENKQTLDFFKEEQYCKHLIGMGYNICVIEALLEGLVSLFPSDLLQSFEGCTYSFPWEPYLSYHRDRQKEAAAYLTGEEKRLGKTRFIAEMP